MAFIKIIVFSVFAFVVGFTFIGCVSEGNNEIVNNNFSDFIIGTYYFTAFGSADPIKDIVDPRLAWQYKMYTPLIGEYDASDGNIVRQHISQAKEYGVNLFIVFTSLIRNKGIRDAFSDNRAGASFSYCITLQKWGENFYDPSVLQDADDIFSWFDLHNNDFRMQNYFKIDGKPVIFIIDFEFLFPKYTVDEIKGNLTQAENMYRGKHGTGIYWIGVIGSSYIHSLPSYWSNQNIDFDPLAKYTTIFDAVTVYNLSTVGAVNVGGTQIGTYDNYLSAWDTFQKDLISDLGNQVYIPSLMAGFDNSNLKQAGMDSWHHVISNFNPDNFYRGLEDQVKFVDPHLPMVIIEAWNEFTEGSVLEPTIEHGFNMLEKVKQFRDKYF